MVILWFAPTVAHHVRIPCFPILGTNRLTVILPVRLYASSPLGLTVATSSPLATHRKVANYSPQNKTHLPETNKQQARISGVEISMCYPMDSNTCIEVTTHVNARGQTPARQFKNNLVLGSHHVCVEDSGTDGMESASGCSFSHCQLNTFPPGHAGSRLHHKSWKWKECGLTMNVWLHGRVTVTLACSRCASPSTCRLFYFNLTSVNLNWCVLIAPNDK
jgi:hypothetical protein